MHAAGVSQRWMCRSCAVGIGDVFCTRIADVRFAWQVVGNVRAGRCIVGVLAASCCGIGLEACRALILRAVTCVSRGRRGTSDALTCSERYWRADPRDRRRESCDSVPCDKSRVRTRVGRCEIVAARGFVDVSLKRTFLGT